MCTVGGIRPDVYCGRDYTLCVLWEGLDLMCTVGGVRPDVFVMWEGLDLMCTVGGIIPDVYCGRG